MIDKLNIGFSDFNWNNYKTNIWWYYVPKGIKHTLIIYLVVGIVFPIIVQKIIDRLKQIVLSFLSKTEKE